ncbi:MAG TPA: GNAT family N-acetyltransferase [Ktedonobacteraceae bacterium]|nr:GNAT family N-acetyltransferase [Ktedonobacteraceae bacterium]
MPIYTHRLVEEADFPRVAELMNQVDREPTSVDDLLNWARNAYALQQDRVYTRIVCFNEDGVMVGFAHVIRWSWMPPGQLWARVVVDPVHQRRGAGTYLYERAIEIARSQNSTRIMSDVKEDCPACLRFAEQRGFRVEHHTFESRLDLATFDEARFAGVIEAVEASGIRFFTLAELGDTEEARRHLYEINMRFSQDNPGRAGHSTMTYEEFTGRVFNSRWFRSDGQIIAADTTDPNDGDKWVGLAAVGYYPKSNSMHNAFTGVDRAYRGRHIALALKLQAIRVARAYHATSIRTDNDSENAPMLAINRKLGYQQEPGIYEMLKNL